MATKCSWPPAGIATSGRACPTTCAGRAERASGARPNGCSTRRSVPGGQRPVDRDSPALAVAEIDVEQRDDAPCGAEVLMDQRQAARVPDLRHDRGVVREALPAVGSFEPDPFELNDVAAERLVVGPEQPPE